MSSGLLFANFNQDYSCVSVGTRKGYSITNCDPFGRVYTQNDGARSIVEMLFCTSLIALVGAPDTPASSPRKLQIVNTKRQSMICELLFPSSILAVKLNRKTLVIVLETEIYVYDISNMRLLHVIETQPNPDAICALSPSADHPYLAYPSPLPSPALAAASASPSSNTAASTNNTTTSAPAGDVLLFSTRALAPANVLRAHRSPLALLALSSPSSSTSSSSNPQSSHTNSYYAPPQLLATASRKGTVIRVFAVPSCDKLYQFRRGAREARVWSLAFNGAGTLLAAGSDSGTVHLWRLGRPSSSSNSSSAGGAGSNGSTNGSNGNGREPASPAESADGQLDAGYDAFVEGKKGGGVSSSIRRRSLHLSSALSKSVASYLPSGLTEMWEPTRDFAFLRLPAPSSSGGGGGERRCVVGLSSTTPHVMVIASDGYFYAYSIDLERGGECVLVKQYSLLESGEEAGM
ncbi:WD40-repeat-containing domain protein [Mycena sp. CBHHK59/15]|nr:WD40-repeat-containing domain protein [Mycena sp. CBHHK59/15]